MMNMSIQYMILLVNKYILSFVIIVSNQEQLDEALLIVLLTEHEKEMKSWFHRASQYELADTFKSSQPYICKLLSGKGSPTLSWIEQKAKILGVRPILLADWFYGKKQIRKNNIG